VTDHANKEAFAKNLRTIRAVTRAKAITAPVISTTITVLYSMSYPVRKVLSQ
jgi:hypothetical protein